jgi:uncharacterized protein YbjT (DUF2867 family)
MKVTVIGGSGLIGTKLIARLTAAGHEAFAASPSSGVNTLTGEGLAKAVEGAAVVVDVSNSPSFADGPVLEFFTTSTKNLLAAEVKTGVRHHVALSIVGTEGLPESGYFRAKVAQERLIKQSTIPYSIVHATQFFEFVKAIADSAVDGSVLRVPPVQFQPIAADDVARLLFEVVTGAPIGAVEIAGPVSYRFDELIQKSLASRNDRREVVADPKAGYFGAPLSERSLVPGAGARLGTIHFEEWSKH